jgi:hypothetical protein
MHVEPIVAKEIPHPLFTMYGKRHYEKEETPTYEWRSSIKRVEPIDHKDDR